MTDLKIDDSGDLVLNSRNDLGKVYGLEEFEQRVMLRVTKYTYDEIGELMSENSIERMRIEANRVVRESQFVDSLDELTVIDTGTGAYQLQIKYTANSDAVDGLVNQTRTSRKPLSV